METFGELYDMHFNSKGTERSGTFTYSNADHAQKAFKEAASSFALADDLVVEWAAVALGSDEAGAVIPDEERKPEERVTAAGLLASIDDGENESDGSDS
ncbi:hypothetical protein L596_030532 [Steinernema carpocapsae]|uniref:Uncharacterized protein n=1 Tax=Steinernema carpocapsae TaxID=34508 RepID=A0A4U5LPQ3_STECR|nr:hypothetical protein L596_030532 [Steinernema carpocapsae]